MGVTLERVQNKFACIIGELCSEPDILSEFAIWLDLRLAEYKSKGAISLECSGETPDPTWLRGHKGPPKRMKQEERIPQTQRLHHYDPAQEYNDNLPDDRMIHERLSPEIVLVKEEPKEVFPVSIHRHEQMSPSPSSHRNHHGKRSASESGHSGITDNSPYKMQKLSPSSSVLEPVNQSLMSIISESGLDESAEMSANMSADFSNMDTPKGNNSLNPIPSTSTGESSDLQVQDSSNPVCVDFGSYQDYPFLRQSANDIMPTRALVQARMGTVEDLSLRRVQHIAGAVAVVERWINKREGLTVHIEDLSPSALNQHLADFYPDFKKIDGEDYDLGYLTKFRCCLDRFLLHMKYPYSTRTPAYFAKSMEAFNDLKNRIRRRQKELCKKFN